MVANRTESLEVVAATTAAALCRAIDDLCARVAAAIIENARRELDREPLATERGRRESDASAPLTGLWNDLALDPTAMRAVLAETIEKRQLSPREADVFAALAHGVPRKRLRAVLGVSENTIKTFLHSALKKLRQKNSDDAVWWLRLEVQRRHRPPRYHPLEA